MIEFDFLHHSSGPVNVEPRELYGYVFGGHALRAWVIFHAILGYVLLGIGAVALLLRLPFGPSKTRVRLHPYFGYAYLLGIVWMPITAIWCVSNGPLEWDVIAFFIFSMYAAAELGWILIRCFIAGKSMTLDNHGAEGTRRQRLYRILHATFMAYSFIMLLGAGISFPLRAIEN